VPSRSALASQAGRWGAARASDTPCFLERARVFPTLPPLSEAWLGPILKWIWKITRLPENALKPDVARKASGKRKGSLATERRALSAA
jgi:hypothetical protein